MYVSIKPRRKNNHTSDTCTQYDNFRLKLLGGDIQITLDTNVYQQPSVTTSDEMQNKVTGLNDQLNKYRSTTVTYTLGSTTEVIDAGTIETWLQIT